MGLWCMGPRHGLLRDTATVFEPTDISWQPIGLLLRTCARCEDTWPMQRLLSNFRKIKEHGRRIRVWTTAPHTVYVRFRARVMLDVSLHSSNILSSQCPDSPVLSGRAGLEPASKGLIHTVPGSRCVCSRPSCARKTAATSSCVHRETRMHTSCTPSYVNFRCSPRHADAAGSHHITAWPPEGLGTALDSM